jgi:hypothetical protein
MRYWGEIEQIFNPKVLATATVKCTKNLAYNHNFNEIVINLAIEF